MITDNWQTRAAKLFCTVIALIGTYLIVKYVLVVILPFLVAFAAALPMSALAKKASVRFGGKEKDWAVFAVAGLWTGVAVAFFAFFKKLCVEAVELFEYFGDNIDSISESIRAIFEKVLFLLEKLPFINRFIEGETGVELGNMLKTIFERVLESVGSAAAKAVSALALGTPRFAVGCVVAVISSFYFCKDMRKIKSFLYDRIPSSVKKRSKWRPKDIANGFKGYAKAYFKLYLVIFSTVFAGLLLLGRQYAFVVALLLAFLDMLPLMSAGILLAVWGGVLVLQGATGAGIGLMVLAIIVFLIKQICEAKFIGKELGVHPLVSLAVTYIGLRVFGLWGIVISPIMIFVTGKWGSEMLTSQK